MSEQQEHEVPHTIAMAGLASAAGASGPTSSEPIPAEEED
jgi:hypothetical protein